MYDNKSGNTIHIQSIEAIARKSNR
jgi:hypothetical protein